MPASKQHDIFQPPGTKDELTGNIERITFKNEENDYVVAQLRLENESNNLVTIIGTLPTVFEGERVQVKGDWEKHRKFGTQFRVHEKISLPPITKKGIQRYLGSGLIRGIGPIYAKRIVRKFGLKTLEILDHHPEQLLDVEGIGDKRLMMIQNAWRSQKEIKKIMMFLAEHEVSSAYAIKIYQNYGMNTLSVLKKNPYQLADDIWGIGFLTADKIAKRLGVAEEEPARIEAGIKYTLSQAMEKGHLYLPEYELYETATKLLNIPISQVEKISQQLFQVGHLVDDEKAVYFPGAYHYEKELAKRLLQIKKAPIPETNPLSILKETGSALRLGGMEYNQQQERAIRKALEEKIVVITGGPGTGKTTVVKGIIRVFEYLSKKIKLAAPTGRAAKRLSEATGRKALTIHRLLEYEPGEHRFKRNKDMPLRIDVLIVDEFSMVDSALAYHLVRALPFGIRLIIVGDVDQLPSVGPGNVLRDIIDSGIFVTVYLSQIFRQAQNSRIIVNAHRINRGLIPELARKNPENQAVHRKSLGRRLLPQEDYGDFLFVQSEGPEKTVQLILELSGTKLPQRYGYNPVRDIQVFTPIYQGTLGANNLNKILQNSLNPSKSVIKRGQHDFRVGDRIMQVRNNYDKRVFNGDLGHIRRIDLEEQKLEVDFGYTVTYDFGELDELVLAYAITVHKSQGSEYPVVIMPIATQHYIMLQRNLLYTAITRAKELIVLIGTKKALVLAVKNNQVVQRYTKLKERLSSKAP